MRVTPGDPPLDPNEAWIFAYASLMWRPGFEFTEAAPATLFGYVRDMCFLSWHYRGTREVPGLVCGLTPAPGAICRGRAYRVAPARLCAVVDYLDGRELISHIYVPRHLAITLADGRTALARAYVADTMHEQFAGDLGPLQKAEAIARGRGSEGRSLDYLADLVAHRDACGINDVRLRELLEMAQTR